MTKAEMIEKYGAEYYERFKEKQRNRMRERYHADIEKSREYERNKYLLRTEWQKAYAKEHRVIYKINSRDTNRLYLEGVDLTDKEIHHFKYHTDVNDKGWRDDIAIMTREEHREWHRNHPEFKAIENVV